MMKIEILILSIALGLTGCGSSPEADPKELSNLVIPEYELSDAVIAEMGLQEDTMLSINEQNKIRVEIDRRIFAELIEREFSPKELTELQEIYTSEVMQKLQKSLRSDEFRVEAIRRGMEAVERARQNHSSETTD